MRKIYLILSLIVSLAFSVSAQQMLVSGSDYPGVNGTYSLTSSGTNFSIYEKDGDPSYYFEGYDLGEGSWDWGFYITNWDQYSSFYFGNTSGSDPTVGSWYGGYDYYEGTFYSAPVISLILTTASVTTATAGSITYFGATLGGEVTNIGGSSVSSRGIKWGLSADNLNNTILIGSGIGSFEEAITGFNSGAIVYYRAFAVNSYGTVYGDVQNFNTLHDGFDILVVSGGGSGGAGYGGGGGGGAVKYFIAPPVSGATAVTVGAGGAAVQITTFRIPVVGNSGESSSFGSLVATSSSSANGANDSGGGGGGGGAGSGGGAGGSFNTASGGTAVSGMGFDGGGAQGNGRNFSNVCGGGGGGAGAIGADGLYGTGGTGGVGIINSISGAAVYYGGGGGGGITYNGDFAGAGGNGGGGAGSKSDVTATSGTANTGGGGGGFGGINGGVSTNYSGAGGSGIVIVRYLGSTLRATGGTITQVGSYTIHTFYSNGIFTLLDVNEASTVMAQPASTSVTEGQNATFIASASGNPTPTTQWQVSTNQGNIWSDISGSITDTFTFNTSLSQNGNQYRAVFTNTAGTINTNAASLTVTSVCTPTSSLESASECGSYVWKGTTYTTSGTQTFTTTNAAGCDSVVTLNLTINNATSSSLSETSCGSYVWKGTTYTTSGAKTFTTTNAAGCDSTVTLDLTINNATSSSLSENACDSYVWKGTTYTTSGAKTFTTTNAAGCDSVVTLNLTINTPTSSTETIAACANYTWNGVTYSTSGTRTWNGTNAAGCDSVATLILTISTSNIYPPFGVTQTVLSNVCNARVYRYTASISVAGNTYKWTLPSSVGGVSGVTVDSGDINSSRTILVRYASNEAAFTTDSIKVRTFNGCLSTSRAIKLANIKLAVPTAPGTITVTSIGANICSNRRYRFVAPSLPAGANSSNSTILPATGYLWTIVGNLGEFATIDSGDENTQKIVVSFSSNAAAVTGDSIKLQYLSSCGNSNARVLKLSNTKLNAPLAPATITITAIQTNVCGARRYRYTAPNLPVASTNNGAATGYLWSLVGSLSNTATIDSGNENSRVITVTFTSNAAAATGDSIRLNYTSDCGIGARKASKLTNTLLVAPSVPATITVQIKSDVCNARTYRYIAPAVLPLATTTVGAASGYLWSAPTGNVGSTGTIDSGEVTSRIITVTYSSNAATGVGDSIRLRYTSGCGDGKIKAQKLSNLVKNGCAPIAKNVSTSRVLNNLPTSMEVNVYPNPTTSQFNVQVKSSGTEEAIVRVLDLTGRFIKSIKLSSNSNVNLGSDLKAGAYMLEVKQGKEVKMVRVVKF